jgi:hypothetical protein
MPNSWDLVPAGLWPLQPHGQRADPAQGAGFVQPPSGPAAWPDFALDYASPEAAAVLRSWAERHALRGMSRQPPVDQNMPPATADPYWQMLADAKASHDLMIAILGLADAVPRPPAKGTTAEKLPPGQSDEQSPPAPTAGQ